ncbi:MAG: Fic family protein [Alphaproteobacteria bacterium]|jgi:cell filamentation protein|nr:Fic family protein [Alphaproteobacteria bacterium]
MKYSTHNDPYTYKDAPDVLINKFNIKNAKDLENLEQLIVSTKMLQINKYPKGNYNLEHFKKLHRYLFAELYDWAGEIRQVTIQKGNTLFCNPLFIESAYNDFYKQMQKDNFLKNIKQEDLYKSLAFYHGELNIIHPFREGNGRTTRAFLSLMLLQEVQLKLDYDKINKDHLIQASIDSNDMDYTYMEKIYKYLLSKDVEFFV